MKTEQSVTPRSDAAKIEPPLVQFSDRQGCINRAAPFCVLLLVVLLARWAR